MVKIKQIWDIGLSKSGESNQNYISNKIGEFYCLTV